jgi:hypothetical protein
MLPRADLLKRWVGVVLNAAQGGRPARRVNRRNRHVNVSYLLDHVALWGEREDTSRDLPGVPDAEKIQRLAAMTAALHEAFDECSPVGAWVRSGIIDRVSWGRMSPHLAERWAETFGWKPLARWADPSRFDPMKEDEWSLPMVAAWIRFLDEGEVCSRWSVYLEASTEWVDVDVDGENRRYALEAGVDRGYFELPHERTETKLDLLKALRSGRLTAKGLRDGKFVEIPAIEWTALRVVGAQDRDGIYKVMTADGSSQAYEEVRIRREQVLAAFHNAAPAWEAELESRINADPRYTQSRAIFEMKQFAAQHSIIIGDREIKAAWKRTKGIDGKAKSGPTGPKQKAQ